MVKHQSKRPKRKRPVSTKYKYYEIDGETIKRTKKACPRCGPGIFLGESKDRIHCGKCHYTEFMGKSDDTTGEQKKPEVAEVKEDKKE